MDISKISAYYLVGGSSTNNLRRHIGYNIYNNGWKYFIDHYIRKDVDLGIRRFHLHNPFGLDALQATMPFNQLRECKHSPDTNLSSLAYDFTTCWSNIINELDIEVTAYIGCLRADAAFDSLSVLDAIDYFDECTMDIVKSRCNVAIDSVARIGVDDIRYGLMRRLELQLMSNGRRLFQEPRPDINMPHLHRFPVIGLAKFFRRSDPDKYKDAAGLYANNSAFNNYQLIVVQEPGEELGELAKIVSEYPDADSYIISRLSTYNKPVSELIADI